MGKALARLGYEVDHQTGSHIRLATQRGGEHHVTVPAHDLLKIGTLNAVLRSVGDHAGLSRDELMRELFRLTAATHRRTRMSVRSSLPGSQTVREECSA